MISSDNEALLRDSMLIYSKHCVEMNYTMKMFVRSLGTVITQELSFCTSACLNSSSIQENDISCGTSAFALKTTEIKLID